MDSSNGSESTNKPEDVDADVDAGWPFNLSALRAEPSVSRQLPCARDDLHYRMQHSKRGRCLILNYYEFSSSELRKRDGTDMDASLLRKTFSFLNFDVETHKDLTWHETLDVLSTESKRDHSSYDCFVLCILTHGSAGILHCKDRQLNTDRVFTFFTANACSSLVGKPKLFFIQACQGEMFDSGTLVHDAPSPSHFIIPNYADLLIFYSTYPGHFSWRNSTRGSWFIQELCNVLQQYSEQFDLMSMLTIVCQKVAFNYQSNVPNNPDMDRKKQIPCIMSTLTRLVVFPRMI